MITLSSSIDNRLYTLAPDYSTLNIFFALKLRLNRQKKKYANLLGLSNIWSRARCCVKPIVIPTIHGLQSIKKEQTPNKTSNSQE
tara:strand:+ start:94 stop:348 length:255 start_codon:yes stop_codon:yes gene_type:complete